MTKHPSTIPDAVHNEANTHLNYIESEYDVTVVIAVAHGSHAWGLSNEDSDYDIKAVYVPNTLHQYAHLGSHRETITREFNEFEIEAWGIQKFGELLYKSNDQALDVLRSPIVYRNRIDRDAMREFIETQYNPIQLYHTYRSISKNNYRKHLSNHLTSNRNNTYPIIETRDDGYLVANEYADTEVFVPNRVIDTPDEEFIDIPFDEVDTEQDDHRYCERCGDYPETLPTKFQTTQTKQNVKRNLAVLRASMHAQYLEATGNDGEHELPHVRFPTFLDEQAPDVFDADTINLAWELVEMKRNGDNSVIGDRVGREFAHPPEEIDYRVHATGQPDQDRLNEFISAALDARNEP